MISTHLVLLHAENVPTAKGCLWAKLEVNSGRTRGRHIISLGNPQSEGRWYLVNIPTR